MIVMKFGGSSLASADRIRHCSSLVRRELARTPVVVVSAHGRTTDMLVAAAEGALGGTVDTSAIERYHLALVDDLGLDARVVSSLLDRLSAILHGVSLLKELTPRTLDHVMSFGECMSARIVAACMAGEGVPATAVKAYDLGLITDSQHGSASPLPGAEDGIRQALEKISLVPVVTGFIGRDRKGNITTLGRSGSDFTASFIGGAAGADEVQIWKDVDGVMTCDPSIDDRARNLPVLSFDEASELAYYGAEVLHPNTLVPAIRRAVPVRVLNTRRPDDGGTRIEARPVVTDRMAKSVVYKENVCLVTVGSYRLMNAVELLAKAFAVLADRGIKVHMATTSEATVSLVTDRTYDDDTMGSAIAGMRDLGEVEVERDMAVVCMVGEELKGKAGVLGRIFAAVEAEGIKARAVSQSASEINVAFLVRNAQIEPAVRALHDLLIRG